MRISRYEIVGLLGQGGMGRVYLARDPRLGREVALKVLTPEYASDTQRLERFRREARIASALNHPHICTIHDMGEEAGHPFIVMECINGRTLTPTDGQRVSLKRVLRIGGQIARALAAAHAAGIVHRDVKPGNVMLRADGYVKVVDFGLACPVAGAPRGVAVGATPLTEAGTLLGTVHYMSPEQARGRDLDGASDVFSLGIVLYEMATGTHPFQADSHGELIQAILSHTPLSADQVDPRIPAPFAELLQRMLAPEPALRPTASEIVATLVDDRGDARMPAIPSTHETPIRHTVGRQGEQEQLLRAFDDASTGRGLFLCLTGEPGIGKTTMMESFLAELGATGRGCGVARGRCSERLAGTEAYLPVIEALEGLLHGEGGDVAARTMKAVAPSWFVQVAPLAGEDSALTRTVTEGGGVTQERLKRELDAFVLEMSRHEPLLLLLDDIHWADPSTVDLLAYLGTRCESRRMLILLSYRPADLALAEHPFGTLKLDLQTRGLCREVALDFLSRDDIERYVDLEFPGHDFPPDLGELIYARTEGSPLFMADLLRYLCDEGVIEREDGRWTLGRTVSDLEGRLPESVRSMVQRKIEQLGEEDHRLLIAAGVQGYEFDAAIVAEALQLDPADVEDRLYELDRVHSFVKEVEEHELPDRTLTLRYRFVHVLYQNALFAALRPARRAALSRAVAEALVRHHGEEDSHVAAELALLFENAREFERATYFFLRAARHAVRIFANHEAATLARRGLDVLQSLHPSEARDRRELALLVTLGPPLKDTAGWGVPEVVRVYERANELCERIGGTPDLFTALWGMWISYSSTADIQTLRAMGTRLLAVAEKSQDPGHLLQAHHALTTTHFVAGDFREALDHAERGRALYDPTEHADHAFVYGGHDPGACCAGFAAQSLWMLGYLERSVEMARTAQTMCEARGHPVSTALMHWNLGVLHQLRRDVAKVREHAEACREVALDQGAPIFPSFLLAWSEAEEGRLEAGLEQMRAELASPERIPAWWQAYFHGLMGQVLAQAGRYTEAIGSIRKAYGVIGDQEVGSFKAELTRLEGVFLRASAPHRSQEPERTLHRAIEIARQQEARMLELRAVVSLGHLLVGEGRAVEVRPMLADLYDWFTEGLDTPDLKEARSLLETVS